MRTTQYIGLTNDALEYVKNAIRTETIPLTFGMFDEEVKGTRYHMPVPSGPNTEYWVDEIVQAEPWSSGPMIFTCLQSFLKKECGQVCEMGKYFEWVLNPTIKNGQEYDPIKGHYYL